MAYVSGLTSSASIQWNGTTLYTECVDINLIETACTQAAALIASVPASDFAQIGTANVTVAYDAGGTSAAVTFNIVGPPQAGTTWVRQVSNVTTPHDLVWDSARGRLYVSLASTDTAAPNTIATVDPVAGSVVNSTAAATNPDLMSMASDGGSWWVGLDGGNAVQRYLLPGMTPDISFKLPAAPNKVGQVAVGLEAAPVNPHTLAVIAGNWGYSPTGDGVYVYDDAVQRPTFVPGFSLNIPMIDWVQWGADDSVLYGNQYTTIDGGGIADLPVTAAGVTLASYNGGLALQPVTPRFDRKTGLLYSNGAVYDPVKLTLVGSFDTPPVEETCVADSTLNRYYCVASTSVGGTDVNQFDLLVYNLTTYALLDTVYFGETGGESSPAVSGYPIKLVRWGNAGLAVITQQAPYDGNGGLFLIDGTAINSGVSADVSTGTSATVYSSMTSLSPQSVAASSGTVTITITGTGFTKSSTACWSCSYIQERFLPTTYVSPTELTVTVPTSVLPTNQPAEISVFDPGTNLFSSNALTFTVLPASTGDTTETPINLCGLGMAWDSTSQMLYVGTADYDGQYPNSIVALNPSTGAVVKTVPVSSDPMYVSHGANGEYLYVAYSGSTNMTQLSLPDLTVASTAVLANGAGETWFPGDLKAAPVSPHTTAVTLIQPGWEPAAIGGVMVFDDNVPRGQSMPGWTGGQTVPGMYDSVAWSSSDSLLAGSGAAWDQGYGGGPMYELQVSSAGLTYLGANPGNFNNDEGNIHSDFGTGLIYSDNGNVANPQTGVLTGTYGASGLAAPDSSLNRMFMLGQTSAQANTDNYTIQSFDEKTFQPVSSITVSNISGTPIEMVRWGTSGLAILTSGGQPGVYEDGLGMLYLVQDASFVSAHAAKASVAGQERVQRTWKVSSKRELLKEAQQR